tara:strand:- start:1156 stop:1338 length:183 start_codon:yes stop_codon:yes gene_type:complete
MSRAKSIKVAVKQKHVYGGIWFYQGIYQKILSVKDLARLESGETLRMKTLNRPIKERGSS